ncbi:UNVERIFIED_CONTAM: Retrovirus-related Pol polyprotein from transposon RE2 [Sesamum latifolium]|uniref:Retrovirus-related Pol polyprotein from transposon RE2 n=1 Tax=Sesamum latifolium TaxID=2727402 RepID=A0AAW2UH37_9LAMI
MLLLLPQRERAKERSGVLSSRRQMMCAFIAMERGTGRGVSTTPLHPGAAKKQKLSKDEMILRLGDGKAVAAEAVGSLSLVEKMTKKPFVGQSAIAKGLLDLVHTDVCGPLSIPARGGFSYFITFTDDHSRYGYVYLIRNCGYYFYDPAEQKVFVSRNAVFLKKDFSSDNQRDEVLIEESSGEPPHDSTASFEPIVHTDGVPILRRSTRESRVPERYRFMGLTSQLDKDPKTYGQAMSDIISDKWLEAMKSEMDSMGSNQVWTLVDPPKGVRPVGCKWVYKRKLGANREVTAFKARLVAKGYTQRPGVDFKETYSPVAMAKSIRILLAIAAWYDYEIW